MSQDKPDKVERIQHTLVTRAERAVLDWLCARLPRWVTPDRLTLLAILAAVGIGLCYVFSGSEPALLWIAIGLFVVHWFGDSLDGSIARYRGLERPSYGFFIDHSADMAAGLLILGGLGLSPYVRIDFALLALAGYYLLSIHTFLLAKVTGKFQLSHGGIGPTEIRIIFIAVTLGLIAFGADVPTWFGLILWDWLVLGAAAVMIGVFVVTTLQVGKTLSDEDNARLAGKQAERRDDQEIR